MPKKINQRDTEEEEESVGLVYLGEDQKMGAESERPRLLPRSPAAARRGPAYVAVGGRGGIDWLALGDRKETGAASVDTGGAGGRARSWMRRGGERSWGRGEGRTPWPTASEPPAAARAGASA